MQFRFFERFGKYVFLERLGRGGMAEVYLAVAPGEGGINKFFAVKKVVSENLKEQVYVELFKEEAQLAIQLQHRNIVPVHDFGFENAQFYLVMEHLQGVNLSSFQKTIKARRKILPLSMSAFIMREVAMGLDHAHFATDIESGEPLKIVHRDINPQNVMLSYTGDVKIIDFGVAKAASNTDSLRKSSLVGKYHYMSPEMIRGHEVDSRSDIFSFGALFWEMITGHKLFDAASEEEILDKIKRCQLPLLKKQNPFVTPELEAIVYKCLKANPDERYQDSHELVKELNFYFSNTYPDFTRDILENFMQELYHDDIQELQQKLRKYSNLHFNEASGDSALAVPKELAAQVAATAPKRPTPTPIMSSTRPAGLGVNSISSVPSAYSIKPFRRKQSRRDKIAFSKELYTGTRLTQESLLSQSFKLRIIYTVLFACAFIVFAVLTHKKSLNLQKLGAEQLAATSKELKNYTVSPPAMMDAKDQQACFVGANGKLYCWGHNDYAQLGFGHLSAFESLSEVPVDLRFKTVSVGSFHTCAITQADVGGQMRTPLKCWGDNSYGQVGDPTTKLSLVPVTVDVGVNYSDVSVGQLHTCGLTQDKSVKCWGQGIFGQLGSASAVVSQKPQLVPLTERVQQISAGAFHTCALSETGRIFCWGRNDVGQGGVGSNSEKMPPTQILSSSVFTHISAGEHHTCGVTLNGKVECWGKNEFGQLGNGSAEPTARPTIAESNAVFTQVSSGKSHTCAIDAEKNLWCWGRNDRGQIAQIPDRYIRKPHKLTIPAGLSSLALGDTFTCWAQGAVMSCQGEHKVSDLRKAASE